MKQALCLMGGLIICGGALGAGRVMPPEIRCSDTEFSDMKFGGVCNNGTQDLVVYGVATCGATAGDRAGAVVDGTPAIDADEDENIYCWCRLADPIVSQQVYITGYLYAGECENWCASACAGALKSNTAFRTAMFTNIKGK